MAASGQPNGSGDVAPNVSMIDDRRAEDHMRRCRVEFRKRDAMPVHDLSPDTEFNTREERLNEELVEDYRRAFLEGAQFPRVVIWYDQERNCYEVVSGRHRLYAAIAAGRRSLDCYEVLEKDKWKVRIFAESVNRIEGIRTDEAHAKARLYEALLRIQDPGERHRWAAEFARQFELTPDHAEEALRLVGYRDRCQAVDTKALAQKGAKSKIAEVLRTSLTEYFKPVNDIAHHLTVPQLSQLVTEVNRAPSVPEGLAVVARWEADRDIRRKTRAAEAAAEAEPIKVGPDGKEFLDLQRQEPEPPKDPYRQRAEKLIDRYAIWARTLEGLRPEDYRFDRYPELQAELDSLVSRIEEAHRAIRSGHREPVPA